MLKIIMRWIDRFCYNHPRFGILNLMRFIVIGNAIVFAVDMMNTSSVSLAGLLVFDAAAVLKGQVWRLVTFIMVPQDTRLIFFAMGLYFYYFMGNSLEREWGSGKFTIYYLMGMILTVVSGFGVYGAIGFSIWMGAHYLNLSMLFALATLYPDTMILLFGIIPVKMKWIGWFNAAYFARAIIMNPLPLKILPVVAILNYLLFCGGWIFDLIRPRKASQQAKTINYKRAARKVRKEQASQPFRHKCSVCGKTDVDSPNLEFRYCSRCSGYHCFCEEHINNHVHFTE